MSEFLKTEAKRYIWIKLSLGHPAKFREPGVMALGHKCVKYDCLNVLNASALWSLFLWHVCLVEKVGGDLRESVVTEVEDLS